MLLIEMILTMDPFELDLYSCEARGNVNGEVKTEAVKFD